MASNPQILSDLRVIQEAGHQIELLTTYKGVPFICRATIDKIREETILVKAQDACMVCLEKDDKPRVLGSDYFEPSVAKVVSLDLQRGEIELGNFTYVGTKLGERMLVRVEPRESIAVNILSEKKQASGQIVDISINGIGVRIGAADYNSTLKPGTIVRALFRLNGGEIDLAGTVLSAFRIDDIYRLSVRFNQNGPQKMIIFRYLVDRRAEIAKELDAAYQASKNVLNSHGT